MSPTDKPQRTVEDLRALSQSDLDDVVRTEAFGSAPEWRAALEQEPILWRASLSRMITSIQTQISERRASINDWDTRDAFEEWRRRSMHVLRKIQERHVEVKVLAVKASTLRPNIWRQAILAHRDAVLDGQLEIRSVDVDLWSALDREKDQGI